MTGRESCFGYLQFKDAGRTRGGVQLATGKVREVSAEEGTWEFLKP